MRLEIVFKIDSLEGGGGAGAFLSLKSMDSPTPGRRQSQTLILSTNVDQKSLETLFSIADWRQMAIGNTVSSDF